MLYGYLKDNKVVYAGRKADGIWKGNKGIRKDGTRRTIEKVFKLFAEEGNPLKEIVIPSNFDYHYSDYDYLEKDGKIVLTTLKHEIVLQREQARIDAIRSIELREFFQ